MFVNRMGIFKVLVQKLKSDHFEILQYKMKWKNFNMT